MTPILFLFGPSGAGKSDISDELRSNYGFLHIDIDKSQNGVRGFALNQFPSEWDQDVGGINFALFASELRRRVDIQGLRGAVVSFPTIHVLTPEQIETASRFGIFTFVLWGTETQCLESRKARGVRIGIPLFSVTNYKDKNRRSFEAYAGPAYDKYRIDMFRVDGTHWPLDHNLTRILARMGWTSDAAD